uniref:SusC/RagA family TonB-linked outer membrane protein n=1 Tax=Algoriphagus sp. PAP.12 TaxID=2996678 RepID=UPI00227C7FC7
MRNLIKVYILVLGLVFLGIREGFAQQSVLSGTVLDSQSQEPIPGASVLLKGTVKGTVSDENGDFELSIPDGNQVLIVSYLGYKSKELELLLPYPGNLRIDLLAMDIQLGGVEVLATGYQNIPESRAAGSFVQVNKELLERKVSTNLLDRLEDVTSGLIFNKTGDAGRDPISIRGRSTLGRFNQPLIVIDNFPFDGSLEDINPNDVESITVLRDASAASIWGARAGNGVIVITTKSGKKDQPLQVDLTANVNWIESSDAFWEPKMAVSDFISVERELFASGYYNSTENSPNNPGLTPVVENLILARDGVITEQEADSRIAALGNYDLRNDLNRYIYQSQLNQQYNVGVSGGNDFHAYRISLGYDHLKKGSFGNSGDRITLNMKEDFRMMKDKLRLSFSFYGVKNDKTDQNFNPQDLRMNAQTPLYPYARLADNSGNPLEVTTNLRESFKREAESMGLLDWAYKPLEEFGRNVSELKNSDWRLNLGASYKLWDGLNLSARYQYWEKSSFTNNLSTLESYETRNMINLYTQVDSTGQLSYPVPKAGILNTNSFQGSSHSARLQLDYNREFKEWRWDILAGGELKSLRSQSFSNRYYGYNPELASSQTVDYFTQFARYSNPRSTLNIPDVNGMGRYTDRFLSAFANSSLQWKQRYLLTASLRRDASNLFGVSSNMRAVPLWSAGLGWTLSEEAFYKWGKVPFMKLRFSYGYNGNVDRSLTAFTTAQVITFNNLTHVNYGQIINPPNENLRWERIKITNLGLDFESKSGRISGTLEVYNKQGLDLIGRSPYAPSTGITTFSGNTASTQTKGYDISISTLNL